ncbi:PREDICTED: cell cycle progression protein 1-like [Elephantulus edwardii]|uniref:cell cycle progression protein 1-like n=1 Tax=Elephantulus edwardii TaxID=28737 RepID=UPI0003F08C01|nr:PREDICTED: cell cycle progression protein 1-like [Elephantulus edwardii]
MAENSNSSDSDSSCDWTLISYEGSDIEMVNSEHGVANDSGVLVLEGSSFEHEEVQVLPGVNSQSDTTVMGEIAHPAVEETKSAVEAEEETPFEDDIIYFGTVSDDSDTVTLEPPKLEEVGIQEEAIIVEEAESTETFHMASSFSSQYTFCQPEIAFSSQHNDDESSSDEISHQPSPAEEGPPAEQAPEPCKENLDKRHFSSDLKKCVMLALVIAIILESGYICGIVQVLRHQQLVKNREDKLSDMKDYISQCQQGQESFIDKQKTLATENVQFAADVGRVGQARRQGPSVS